MQYIIHIFAQLESGILSTRGVIYYTLGIIEHHGIQNKIKPLCAAPPFQPVLTGVSRVRSFCFMIVFSPPDVAVKHSNYQ